MVIKKAVCMHEEDAGTLWKHTEYRTGHSEVRRSRRLVLSFIATIANYEYGFYWYFYQVSCPCAPLKHALMVPDLLNDDVGPPEYKHPAMSPSIADVLQDAAPCHPLAALYE